MTEILDSNGNKITKGVWVLDADGKPEGIVLDVTDPDGDTNDYGRPIAVGPYVFVSYDGSNEVIRYTATWNATGPWDDYRDDYTCDDVEVAVPPAVDSDDRTDVTDAERDAGTYFRTEPITETTRLGWFR